MARFDIGRARTGESREVDEFERLNRAVYTWLHLDTVPQVAALFAANPDAAIQALFSESERNAIRDTYQEISRIHSLANAANLQGRISEALMLERLAAAMVWENFGQLQARAPELASELHRAVGDTVIDVARGAAQVVSAVVEAPAAASKGLKWLGAGLLAGLLGFGLYKATREK